MPAIYTAKAFGCTGGNVSPPLQWSGAPRGTKSFVVTLFDRDERSTPSGWWHWVIYDLPAGTLQGRSDLGEDAYHGPCPAKGDPPHRYTFAIYALDISTAQEHLLGTAVFVARYGR